MISYYKNQLYPLQDKVLKIVEKIRGFYLTGGTALSRCYYNHRYSDDLDLFVNADKNFISKAEKMIQECRKKFKIELTVKTESYCSFLVDKKLKVDLVNDVISHIGGFKKFELFSRVDNVKNILSNKITALISREEPKDVVDIWKIAKKTRIDWEQIFVDTASKAVGIFPPVIAKKLDSFPMNLINKINWIEEGPSVDEFKLYLDKIVLDILKIKISKR